MKRNTLAAPILPLSALAFSSPVLRADEEQEHHKKGTRDTPQTAEAAKPEKPKAKPYPLSNCIVPEDEFGEMGTPVVFEYKDQEIKLCCKGCRKEFDKEPAKFLKKFEPEK